VIYALLGLVFGVVGGMGLGGGIVLIPAMTILMGVEQHAAQGMTLFAYLPMAAFAVVWYIRKKAVRLKPVLFLIAFGLLGAAGGFPLVRAVETGTLRLIFGGFLIAAALVRVWRQEVKPALDRRKQRLR